LELNRVRSPASFSSIIIKMEGIYFLIGLVAFIVTVFAVINKVVSRPKKVKR